MRRRTLFEGVILFKKPATVGLVETKIKIDDTGHKIGLKFIISFISLSGLKVHY